MTETKGFITVGCSEVAVSRQSDGSYLYDVKSIAAAINKTATHARSWFRVRGCYVRNLEGIAFCEPTDAVAYWSDMAENGNPEAYNLLVALTAEALHNRSN